MKRKSYTGVGSRETPMYILYLMSELAIIFEKKGYILRSGCATGADAAFEDALEDPRNNAEIYIPNKAFPLKMGTDFKNYYFIPKEVYGTSFDGLYRQATRLIHQKDIHKYWFRLKENIMDLHNRNMFQVLGKNLDEPSSFNICFTKNKELKYEDTTIKTGGTGTSINASDLYNIELFNLSVDEHYKRLSLFVEKNKHLINYERLNKVIPRSSANEMNGVKHLKPYSYFLENINKDKNERIQKIEGLKELLEDIQTKILKPKKKESNKRRIKP